ncbi:hypothetical protein SEPCBS119000_002774 [Sporothrix epigloea]|uniref:Uncharacterized protein n=1 Tax=Sporothrix epigloea TaxID=1892477 RepID=A0ABP0DI63_9PEZI
MPTGQFDPCNEHTQIQQQQQLQTPTYTPTQSQTPLPASRKFRVASARQTISRGEDAIEDGSSPAGSPSSTAFASQDDALALVVRESPIAKRILDTAPGRFPEHHSQQTRAAVVDDIQDASSSIGSDAGHYISQGPEDSAVDNDDEIWMPDSIPEETPIIWPAMATNATPSAQGIRSWTRPQSSAARLLSSIQPLKRRKLFVSPGLITSSPPEPELAAQSQDDPVFDSAIFGEADKRAQEEEPDENLEVSSLEPLPVPFPVRFQKPRSRLRADRDDEIVDNESSEGSGDDEDIRDILRYGELFESGDSSDDGYDAMLPTNRLAQDMHKTGMDGQNGQDDADYDTDMMLDITPPRVRQARLLRLQGHEQRQHQRQPTIQRARMFKAARRSMGEEDADNDGDGQNLGRSYERDGNWETDSQNILTTPARQRYHDALLHLQPPPDLFSPQKKRRRPKRKTRAEGELTSPSAAAIHAPEQYVPGGLAAGLRDWLVQIKSGGGKWPAAGSSGRYDIEQMETAPGFCLALARRRRQQKQEKQEKQPQTDRDVDNRLPLDDTPAVRLLLAGDRRQREPGPGATDTPRPTVSIAHPAWDIVLGGQQWTVAADWAMQDVE